MFSDDAHTAARDRPRVVSYRKVRVLVEKGPDQGRECFIVNQTLRVGTSSDNDLVLSDRFVSRRHCAIEPVSDGLRIRDEGARNAVLLDGIRIRDATVSGAVRLSLGDTVLLVEPQDAREEREQALENRFGDLLGQSARMRELFVDLARIAASNVTLLIEGETGTGKELVAESVHANSPRASGPFVVFDCGAVAPQLAEDALFGHERGAFTGAHTAEPGVFEQADGGTLFLDELGELPKELQPKLLRALESNTVQRLGSRKPVKVDVRVLAATNRNLEAEVARGNFRQDLYFRFTAHVRVPPLRDRMDDLPLLVGHFLAREEPARELRDISQDVWAMFNAYHWPGNVRELSNVLRRIQITPGYVLPSSPGAADGLNSSPMASESRPSWPRQNPVEGVVPLRVARRQASDDFEREYLKSVLEKAAGSTTKAAALAEVSVQMVRRLLRRHGLG
ncbi:MAG TPA: sigma 54-interacting transcriptional regulator, partial [Polyangiaceae bacterium]